MSHFYLGLPPKWFLKSLKEAEFALARISVWANNVNIGKFNVTGTVTLAANSATTTLNDVRIGAESYIGFMPTTANAAAGLTALYVTGRGTSTCTLNHANNAQADRTYDYAVFS